MKNTQKVLSAALAGLSLLAASSAIAIPVTSGFNYQDVLVLNNDITGGHNITGTFNITDGDVTTSFTVGNGFDNHGTKFTDLATFDNTTATITSANVYFYIENGNSANDLVTINLTDDTGFFSGRTGNANFIVGDGINSADITLLNDNGTLGFTIANSGTSDFTVDAAQIQVYTKDNSNARTVPDGGSTVALLGTGLLGCAVLSASRRGLKAAPAKK